MRVLAVIAEPTDLPRFGAERVWAELALALGTQVTRLSEATEAGLKRALAESHYDVVHFVAHAEEKPAANYCTVALLNSEGKARKVAGRALGTWLAQIRAVVLQRCDEASPPLDTLAAAVSSQGPAVRIATPRAPVPAIYRDLAQSKAPAPAAPAAAEAPAPSALPAEEMLRQKRAAGQFDVFLCHNWNDKPAVISIAQRLKDVGILPWLDIWELPPGQPWQRLLEQQIGTIRSAAVFAGAAGLGPWQEQEIDGFLRQFVKRRLPVIPVLLPDAPAQPTLPVFLEAMIWVDFRQPGAQDPFELLLWGITGERPRNL